VIFAEDFCLINAFKDWAIVVCYGGYVIWHGLKLSQNKESAFGFFLGGRGLPWWTVGLSIMATQMSAITLIGATGQAYEDGMRFIQFYLGLPLAMVILWTTAAPYFYKARVFTA
jgi:Na+/proline symporter